MPSREGGKWWLGLGLTVGGPSCHPTQILYEKQSIPNRAGTPPAN